MILGIYCNSLDSSLSLDIPVFGQRGADPAAAFLHKLIENHDRSETKYLANGYGYLTASPLLSLSDHLDYVDQNLIEKWFHTFKMRVDRFHNSWVVDGQSFGDT